MTWIFDGLRVLTASFLVGAWLAAAVVYASAPRRAANRLLAVILCLEGVTFTLGPLFSIQDSAARFYAAAVLADVLWAALPPLYLAFLGAALDTRITRPFRGRTARTALVLLSLSAAAFAVVRPSLFVGSLGTDPYGLGSWTYEQQIGEHASVAGVLGVVSLGLVAAIFSFRPACPGNPAGSPGTRCPVQTGVPFSGGVGSVMEEMGWARP
ncbi:MAG: hypothetical protein ACT4PT_14330, partial [Methanobacteriota archaeon]